MRLRYPFKPPNLLLRSHRKSRDNVPLNIAFFDTKEVPVRYNTGNIFKTMLSNESKMVLFNLARYPASFSTGIRHVKSKQIFVFYRVPYARGG
jgi:hypothetical protein